MHSAATTTRWRDRIQLRLATADAYFLSDDLRRSAANEVAYARVGVVGCLGLGVALCLLVAAICIRTPWPIVATIAIGGVTSLGLPFWLKQSDSIRTLGHVVCGQLLLLTAATLVFSGGRAIGMLPVIPIVPMLALLMLGGRAVIQWGLAALAVLGLGIALAASEAAPLVADFQGLSPLRRYSVALISLVTMLGVGVLFERLWHRSARDFADRTRANLALSEERYRALLEHASEGILILDAGGYIQFASAAAERLIGFEPGRLVGRRLPSLTDAAGLREIEPFWRLALERPGERIRAELLSAVRPPDLDPDQPAPQVEITITNCLDHPAVRGVVIHIHDVSDLARAKANYQNLVEESIQGIAVVCQRRVVYVNPAMARLFDVPAEGFLGLTIEEALARVHREDRGTSSDTLSGTSLSSSIEIRVRRASDQTWRWIQCRWADAVWEGQRAYQIAYADVTAQRELEETRRLEQERLEARIAERTRELEASQHSLRAQERLAAVGTLAAGVAHQINNPVGAILAAADFAVVTEGDAGHADVAHSAFQEIRSQAIRCGKIIRSVLQFSRAEPTEKWTGDLVGVLRTAVDVTRRFAKESRANVTLEVDRSVSASSVLMSPIELEQVFVNLILNAIQAQPSGAEVQVTARRMDHEIRVRVEDDGPGVPAADRDRIFDPFFTTRLKGGGTGLGLSVAYSIIADHGGRMELLPSRARPECFACFEVMLPLEKPEAGIPVASA